jgi:hypothetical protein
MNYTKKDVLCMNHTYGYGWIINVSQLQDNVQYQLYATGYCTLSGRKYVALSKPPTIEDKQKYNLI